MAIDDGVNWRCWDGGDEDILVGAFRLFGFRVRDWLVEGDRKTEGMFGR